MPFQKGNQLWRKAVHKGSRSWNKGLTKANNASLLRISIATSEHWKKKGHPKGMLGKHHSEETKLKMSLAGQGSKNGNWKGGLTKLVRGIRRSPEYYQWRKAVLERDDHTCQDCKVIGNVEAHHIRSIFEYPDGIFEVENGLSLCENCHNRNTFWQKLKGKRRNYNVKKSYRMA